ncbi:MAG TPA: hypothetical protein VGV16_08965 [Gammaproteobacteria bacterium]|nr:hypothetical protein [Gammaproteobacteria bacterium]
MRRILWILPLAILSFSVAVLMARADEDDQPADAGPASALVQTVAAAEHDVALTLPAYGSISAGPLLSLTAAPETAAAYARAKAEADFARTALTRTRALFKEHLATNIQLADAERAAAEAAATLSAQERLAGGAAESAARAPDDRIAAHGANTRYVLLGVDPEDAGKLKPGMAVRITAVFDPRLTAQARLDQVGGQVDEATGLVDLTAPLTGKEAARFMPGAAVNGAVVLEESHVLAVPRSAVLHDEQGDYLFVVKAGVAHRVDIQAGTDDGTWVAVEKGLDAGDEVVTLGNYELSDGMAVREPKE